MGWLLGLYYWHWFAALNSESHHFIYMIRRFSSGVDWEIGLQLRQSRLEGQAKALHQCSSSLWYTVLM